MVEFLIKFLLVVRSKLKSRASLSAACIIATNASQPDSSRILAHQSLRHGQYAVA
jgi:hypothetical protein